MQRRATSLSHQSACENHLHLNQRRHFASSWTLWRLARFRGQNKREADWVTFCAQPPTSCRNINSSVWLWLGERENTLCFSALRRSCGSRWVCSCSSRLEKQAKLDLYGCSHVNPRNLTSSSSGDFFFFLHCCCCCCFSFPVRSFSVSKFADDCADTWSRWTWP